jgi:hypothetical protein
MQEVPSPAARSPVCWSNTILEKLNQDYVQALHDPAGLRASLLAAQLKVTLGFFAEADLIINDLLSQYAQQIRTNESDIVDEVMWTAFISQRFDVLVGLLENKASLNNCIEIAVERGRAEFWAIEVCVVEKHRIKFVFNEMIFRTDHSRMLFLRFVGIFPLFAEYVKYHATETGSVIISLGDEDFSGSVGFCTRRADAFLIPDYYFIVSHGYETIRNFFLQNPIPWDLRHPIALWRGSTTGDPNLPPERWRELPRVRLCALARSAASKKLIDACITEITQVNDSAAIAEITNSGYLASYVPPHDFPKWKYQIDIDGNTNSWPGLFVKLLTGSVVLKVASPRGYRQWYYDKLKPWINYVPVSSDLSDLPDRLEWLRAHDDIAREIGYQGKLLADSLDYAGELTRAANALTAAKRCLSAGSRLGRDHVLTPNEVELAYRLMLGRAPENQDVVYRQIASVKDLDELRQAFLTSDEFKEKISSLL